MTSINKTDKNSKSNLWQWIFLSALLFVIVAIGTTTFLSDDMVLPEYKLAPMVSLEDPVIVTKQLSQLEKIYLEKNTGAESIVLFNGSIYTGVLEGKILRLNESGVFTYAKLGSVNCQNLSECGRPLGIRLSEDKSSLLAIDAYLGLFSISLSDGSYKKLFPTDDSLNVTFFDDFAILPNGSFILSEASTLYALEHLWKDTFHGIASGRLIMFDPKTKKHEVIAENLRFPNGVELHSDGKSVMVVESFNYRVLRLSLDDGKVTIFSDGLPGIPDNIRASPRGGYWVPVSLLRTSFLGKLCADLLPGWPKIRYAIFKLFSLWPYPILLKTNSAMLLRLDDNGHIMETWNDPENSIPNIVEVNEHENTLYLSSYFLPYIGRVSVKENT